MSGTQSPSNVTTKLRWIAELTKRKDAPLTALGHHIDQEFLKEAYRRTRKDSAPGVDGQTAKAYGEKLDENLGSLLDRFKAGTYRAPPVRRVHIPKGDGTKTRPIGIPTFEDKVLQRAVTMVLESVYEQEFLDCSYGFRPGRSAHQALEQLGNHLMRMHGGWVLEADIQDFFGSMEHACLRRQLDQRVRDGVLRRAIDKWLNAGIMEAGRIGYSATGTPQGGVISPLLANVYLHEVLDKWFETEVKPRLTAEAFLIRYADDFVMVFMLESDARRVMAVLPKRLGKFSLSLHPEKTRLMYFKQPPVVRKPNNREPESFELLGFKHFWGKSRKGKWILRLKTAPSRFTRALLRVAQWCRRTLHLPVPVQHKRLVAMLQGHYAYFGVTGNIEALKRFQWEVARRWHYWLNRRSQRAKMTWEQFNRLLKRHPLPNPVVVHSIYRRAAKP